MSAVIDDEVRYALVDGVARIVLDKPPVNTLTLSFVQNLVAAFRRAAADPAARAVLLTSAHKRFSAGLDLDLLIGKTAEEVRPVVAELYLGLYDAQRDLGKPSIAVVQGAARGGGMTIALSCDMIVAAESATFGYPEIKVGLLPAIHFVNLHRIVGRHRAFDLLFSGRDFGAQEALALGLVSRVEPDETVLDAAMQLASGFAALPEGMVRMGRAAFHRQFGPDHRRSIADAVDDISAVVATEEAQASLRAFGARRERRRLDAT